MKLNFSPEREFEKFMENLGIQRDELLKKYIEEAEKATFDQLKADGDITEAVLIMNPKHKGVAHELMGSLGAKIDILWSPAVEENKCYMVQNEAIRQRIRVTKGTSDDTNNRGI